MPTAENALLKYEAGQTSTAMSALTDSGDHKQFTSGASLFSRRSGYEPVVRPDGLATGGLVVPGASGSNDVVDVAALTCYLAGVKTSVSAAVDQSVTRGSAQDNLINSITVTSAGAIAVIAGTEGATMVETRGSAGGPPHIPVGDIEIAQVRLTSQTAASVTSAEIFAVPGVHVERYDYPVFEIDYEAGEVNFAQSLALSHTGDLPKGVYASYAAPVFADVPEVSDVVLPETSHSVSSTQIYGKTKGSSSSSLGQGSFTAYLNDGVNDALVGLKNEALWFEFYPDRFSASKARFQGKLGISRSFPAGDSITAACTVSADSQATEVPG